VNVEIALLNGEVKYVAKEVWNTKNPKKKSTPLSSSAKSAAKARAAKAGRPYPNLIDNMWASKQSKGK